MAVPDELLDIKQAAAFLQVSETSLRRWTTQGRLPCLRVGRKRERRFRLADLVAFLEEEPGSARGLFPSPVTLRGGIHMPPGTHLCAIYSSTEGRTRQAAAFVTEGLESGAACFVVASAEAQQDIMNRLEQGLPDLASAIQRADLVFSEYADTAAEQYEFWERSYLAALSRGVRTLRAVGDVTGGQLAQANPWSAVLEYERGYDRRFAKRFPVVSLCQYSVDLVPGVQLLDLYCCHRDNFAYPVERLID